MKECRNKLGLAAQYMVHHPDNFGQTWNIQLAVVPVLPKLIKGNLFGSNENLAGFDIARGSKERFE